MLLLKKQNDHQPFFNLDVTANAQKPEEFGTKLPSAVIFKGLIVVPDFLFNKCPVKSLCVLFHFMHMLTKWQGL